MYPKGNSEYLVSDPRLTVSEAAAARQACNPQVANGAERGILSQPAGGEGNPTAAELDAFMGTCPGSGFKSVVNVTLRDPTDPTAGLRVPTEGDSVDVWYQFAAHTASRLGLTIERQWMNHSVIGNPWTIPLNDSVCDEYRMRDVMRFRLAVQQVLGAHGQVPVGPLSVHVAYVLGESRAKAPSEPTPPQPTESELLAAELAKPPRGVSVEQWRMYIAHLSEDAYGRPVATTSASVANARYEVECGNWEIPARIMFQKPEPKAKNWWEK